MNMQIYYFTGTGNSLAVAKDIANSTAADLVPIVSVRSQTTVSMQSDVIGIVFPVYYGELPLIVKEFAGRLANLREKYVFAVCTYGGAAMASLRVLRRELMKNGTRLSAAFGVHMPQNAFLKPGEDQEKVLSGWNRKREHIVKKIARQAKGVFYNSPLIESVIAPFMPMVRAACRKTFLVQTGLPADTPTDVLIRHLDTGFFVSEECSGCGICAMICPVENIEIRHGEPEWLHHCENCLACVNWCPSYAIKGGITKGFFYRNPHIKSADMFGQRGDRRSTIKAGE